MGTERDAMTLERISKWHRNQAYACGLHEHLQDEGQMHDEMADAIDAQLSRAAEPVAFAIVGNGEVELVFARDVLHDKRGERAVARELGEGKHALYTHLSEDARDRRTALDDALQFGTGFTVDGKRIAPERVCIYHGHPKGDAAMKGDDDA